MKEAFVLLVTYKLRTNYLLHITEKRRVVFPKDTELKIVGHVHLEGFNFVIVKLVNEGSYNGEVQWLSSVENLEYYRVLEETNVMPISDEVFNQIIEDKIEAIKEETA